MLRHACQVLLSAILVAVSLFACAQPRESDVPTITITTDRDPVDKSYRRMVMGMDVFEQNRHLAPQAALRFKLLPRRRETDMSRIGIEITGETFARTVAVAADNTFALERIQKALAEDASVRSNRRTATMTWRADIRTPGFPPDTRRLGDLRLECAVGMVADLVSNRLTTARRIADLAGRNRNYCNQERPRYFFFAERPLFSVTLVSGARREAVPAELMYAGALDRRATKEDLATCDCEVLLDRAYFLPLGDRSWPDDTRVEFTYMDDGRVAAESSAAANAAAAGAQQSIATGKSAKSDVLAALGRARSVRFDTGFEVWAYRINDPAKAAPSRERREVPMTQSELVILFAPSGIAIKTRLGPDVGTQS